ncbi:MAG: hypothetical protein JSV74_03325, partial [Dehalococcoidia bacterium]
IMTNYDSSNIDYNLDAYKPSSDPKIDIKYPVERVISYLNDLGPDSYAWYAMLMLLFNHIDFLGHLQSGGSSRFDQSKCAVRFIRSYLGRVDDRYKEVGGLIYHMLRHGLSHKSSPKRLKLSDDSILGYTFSNTKKREKHLMVYCSYHELRLRFSIHLFYEDLLAAIDLYCEDIIHDNELKNNFINAWEMLKEPEYESNIRSRYIEATDLAYINKQILSLPSSSN